jgi:hypothetical protein
MVVQWAGVNVQAIETDLPEPSVRSVYCVGSSRDVCLPVRTGSNRDSDQ